MRSSYPPSPLGVRIATPDDESALLSMMPELAAIDRIPWTRAEVQPPLQKLLEQRALGVCLLYFADGFVAGYAVLTWSYDLEYRGREAYLTELFLLEEFRGKGLGGYALDHAARIAASFGARALHAMVLPTNRPALSRYQKSGFVLGERITLTRLLDSGPQSQR